MSTVVRDRCEADLVLTGRSDDRNLSFIGIFALTNLLFRFAALESPIRRCRKKANLTVIDDDDRWLRCLTTDDDRVCAGSFPSDREAAASQRVVDPLRLRALTYHSKLRGSG